MSKHVTHEFLVLATVLDADVRLSGLVENGEREVLDIGLDLGVVELATDETLRVKDGVVGVHRDLVLGGISDQTLVVGEGDIRRGGSVTLVVGNDFNTVVLPDTDATEGTDQVGAPRKRRGATHE